MNIDRSRQFLALLIFILSACAAGANPVQLPVTKDNSIILYPGEYDLNHGAKDRIRIKGNQHLVTLGFDTSQLRGNMVRSAVLVCRKADCLIPRVTISTIQCRWKENTSSALQSGEDNIKGWGVPGIRFPAITDGNGFSLVCNTKSEIKNGCYRWKVDPDLINACSIGVSHGLTIHEVDSDYSRNPRIWARESGDKGPYLLLDIGGTDPAPTPPTKLRLTHRGDPDSIELHLLAPRSGFAYDVRANDQPVPSWNIPFVDPGKEQTLLIRDVGIKRGQAVTVQVSTINRNGKRAAPVSIRMLPIQLSTVTPPNIPDLPPSRGALKGVSVIPMQDRYDLHGRPIGDLPNDYRTRNELFDGRGIAISAARGEVVGFQLLLRGNGRVTAACKLPGLQVESFKALYVKTDQGEVPDPLIPLDHLDLRPERDAIACFDIYVPFDFNQSHVFGQLSISDGRSLPIDITIRNFALPRRASFICEMNGYGLPNTRAEFYRLQDIAYDHRAHVNLLHYSHRTAAASARKCNMDMILTPGQRMNEKRYNDLSPESKQAFWDDFVTAFGQYLNGQHFKGRHRGVIPAPGFYLTFHESWPLNVRPYFNGNPDAYEAFKEHPEYSATYVAIMRDFLRVAKQQKWYGAGFQVYLNNKGSLNDPEKAPWILDEPSSYWDYRALAYYADLTRKARSGTTGIRIDYRVDISRPQFDRGELLGKSDLWVVNMGSFRNYNRLVLDRAHLTGERIWVYGTTNHPKESNRITQAWLLEAFRRGAGGVVPWQTINIDGSALKQGDQLGLFIFDKANADKDGAMIRHSMRLKSYRRGEQDIEYLILMAKQRGLSREEMTDFIDHYLDLDGEVRKKNDADAGTMKYNRLAPDNFRKLREAAARVITTSR